MGQAVSQAQRSAPSGVSFGENSGRTRKYSAEVRCPPPPVGVLGASKQSGDRSEASLEIETRHETTVRLPH